MSSNAWAANVSTASTADFDALVQRQPVNMALIDIMLPGEDGLSLCRRVRAAGQLPLMILSARSDDVDRIVGLEIGADDYLPKPFNPRELVARVRALLRRSQTNEATIQPPGLRRYAFEGWLWDVDGRSLIAPDPERATTVRPAEQLRFIGVLRTGAENGDALRHIVIARSYWID